MLTQRQIFLNHLGQTNDIPLMLEIESAEGIYLTDVEGKKYMDLISGISVSNLGHKHPKIIEAVNQQMQKYAHLMVYGEFIQSPQTELAQLLVKHLPKSLDCCYFTNSGTEATEGAMKLAKRVTGRPNFVSAKNSYHGSTQGALSLMGDEFFKQAFRPLIPGVKHLVFNDVNSLEVIDENTAGVVIELIQAEVGVSPASKEFAQAVRKKCDETGALLIIDEIQTGMGRTGTLFAFEQYDIVPDVLLLAKGFGGGMPLGAFISSKENIHELSHNPVLGHISTFGGHPVSCAAAKASLEILLEEELISQVNKKASIFKERLNNIHSSIKLNQAGLMMAIEFATPELNQSVIKRCVELGLVTDWFLFAPQCLRIAPPLIITEEEISNACDLLEKAIKEHL